MSRDPIASQKWWLVHNEMSCFTIENVRLVRFYIDFNFSNRKTAHFIVLIIIFEVLWDLLTWWHDTNHRKPEPHAGIWENLLFMLQPGQRRCQISPWSHGHPLTSLETHYYTSLSLQDMGQTKWGNFQHLRDVGSWMSGMNYRKWKMNFEFRPWFFLWAKISA